MLTTRRVALLFFMSLLIATAGRVRPAHAEQAEVEIKLADNGGGGGLTAPGRWPGMTLVAWHSDAGVGWDETPAIGDHINSSDGHTYVGYTPGTGYGGWFIYKFVYPLSNGDAYFTASWTFGGLGDSFSADCTYRVSEFGPDTSDPCYANDYATPQCDTSHCYDIETCWHGPCPISEPGLEPGIAATSAQPPVAVSSGDHQAQTLRPEGEDFAPLVAHGYAPDTRVRFTCNSPAGGTCTFGNSGASTVVSSDGAGVVTLTGLHTRGTAGTYSVSVSAPGYETLVVTSTVTATGGATDEPSPSRSP